MIQNIAIIGLNRDVSYEVAKQLATELDMFFFDGLELFEFDNIPRTLTDILKEYGVEYYRKKEKSIVGYSSEFENCVINLESGVSENEKNFVTLKETTLVVYLKDNVEEIKNAIAQKEYKTQEEKEFFDVDLLVLKNRDEKLRVNADLVVEVNGNSVLKTVSEIIRAMKNYYIK